MNFYAAITGILFVLSGSAFSAEPIFCDVQTGLNLINRPYYAPEQIQMILRSCDQVSPNDPSVLLLHALFARKSKQNELAIQWFFKAQKIAPRNLNIALELAATYEMNNQLLQAEQVYQHVLELNPQNRSALLGEARVARLTGQLPKAQMIYQKMLTANPADVDALNGMGWINAALNHLVDANYYFNASFLSITKVL